MTETRLRRSFAKQGLMGLFGAEMTSIAPGQVEISLTPKPELSQQHGFIHGGALTAIADSAAGYAALSLMPANRVVDLSRIYAAPITRLGCLAFEGQGAFASQS